jgi:hypothetical protein
VKVFASCSSYALGVMISPSKACAAITRAVSDEQAEQLLPAVHALRELRRLCDVELSIDGGASHLAKSRSRQFAAALESDADVWLTIDDDCDTTQDTLANLLAAVTEGAEPRVCIAPCCLRGDPATVNVEWTSVYTTRSVHINTYGLVLTRSAVRGGFGLVAMNRAALVEIAGLVPSFRDGADQRMKPAAFLEVLEADGAWLGEDLAFFARLRGSRVVVEGLISGETTHAGSRLDLSQLR